MPFLLVAYIGGALTILSPCILPVIPFVLARAGRSFLRDTLPMLAGMAITFALVASLGAVGGGWAVRANEIGRLVAILLLALFGTALLLPGLANTLARPFVAGGNRLIGAAGGRRWGAAGSLLVGVATGMLWTPCAGPILGLVLTGAALNGANIGTALLLLAYAAGAGTSLAVALLAGRLALALATLRGLLGAGEWVRRSLGAAVLAGVTVIALRLDTGALARVSYASTTAAERAVLNRLRPAPTPAAESGAEASDAAPPYRSSLPVQGSAAPLEGAVHWLNSPPLATEALRDKVVLVDFWTYSCINCIRTTPYLRAWAERYRDQGLVVVGVHTPEFAFEKRLQNVRRAVSDFGITYPVAVDSDYRIWRAWRNNAWPAFYLVDASGRIRYSQFGEGHYDRLEAAIQDLLREAGSGMPAGAAAEPRPQAIEAAPDLANIRSGETYVGYRQASNFASRERVRDDAARDYSIGDLRVNEWGLSGNWTVQAEQAVLNVPGGGLDHRFSARDLHLVLGPGGAGSPVRFRVTIDGQAPGADHGADTDAEGYGTVDATRLYQLVRQSGAVRARRFEIRFLDPGVEAFAFTFG
ncbi:cytochrome c biogenesis protein DipZ [Roseomonas populi]|uniref:Cytochrome c biogenesis protein DipZ n=1 Tax=Roseomonas populi TaxID=3121582 RepID=A0ABT1X6T2_9PROT|nr:cytochrome c biogenesis protein DipZ [Roseomonas pecuniae]MCR0983820.1 cytochrome c biogenesis protein DipZ [Roseomonas pecuniae]